MWCHRYLWCISWDNLMVFDSYSQSSHQMKSFQMVHLSDVSHIITLILTSESRNGNAAGGSLAGGCQIDIKQSKISDRTRIHIAWVFAVLKQSKVTYWSIALFWQPCITMDLCVYDDVTSCTIPLKDVVWLDTQADICACYRKGFAEWRLVSSIPCLRLAITLDDVKKAWNVR